MAGWGVPSRKAKVGQVSNASLEASDTAKAIDIVRRETLGDTRKAEADRLTSRVVRAEVNLIVELWNHLPEFEDLRSCTTSTEYHSTCAQ